MAETGSFRTVQTRFAAHIRDPETQSAPEGIEDRRLAIYRDLFFNNISSLLAGTFPVLHELLGPDKWRALIREFFARHRCHTPYFLEIPREFLGFFEETGRPHDDEPPFLNELAHYEWTELELSVDEAEIPSADIDTEGDLLAGVPVVSPLVRVLNYRFPVHRIGPEFQPAEAPDEATWLLVYRNREDEVGFMAINPVTARLLELAAQETSSGRDLLAQIASELGHPDPETVIRAGGETLETLRAHAVIAGTRGTNPD